MGLLDKFKRAKGTVEELVTDAVDKHGSQIEGAVDKAAALVDEKTKGKYSDKIGTATEKAKGAVEKLGSESPPSDSANGPDSGPDAPAGGPSS